MEYTKNYHLPQWVETDRVLMRDFNQAMAEIESGLDGGQSACRERTAELEGRTLDGLFRAAENHYQLVTSGASLPRQIGVFRQVFDGSTPLNDCGMMQKDGYAWMTWSGQGFTEEEFKKSLVFESHLSVYPSNTSMNTPLIITFTAKGAGRLEQINFLIGYDYSGSGNCTYSLSVRDLTTGLSISGTRLVDQPRTGGTYTLTQIYPNLDLQTGHKYQIKLTPIQSATGLGTSASTSYSVVVASYQMSDAELVHSFSEPEDSLGGLAFVRYSTSGTRSTLLLEWDGETIAPAQVRTITDEKGRSVKEAVYRRMKAVPAESSLRLRLNCYEAESISLYEWGGILI